MLETVNKYLTVIILIIVLITLCIVIYQWYKNNATVYLLHSLNSKINMSLKKQDKLQHECISKMNSLIKIQTTNTRVQQQSPQPQQYNDRPVVNQSPSKYFENPVGIQQSSKYFDKPIVESEFLLSPSMFEKPVVQTTAFIISKNEHEHPRPTSTIEELSDEEYKEDDDGYTSSIIGEDINETDLDLELEEELKELE
jgi:hypothetical protein